MFPPADRSPMRNCSSVFFFCIFAFCLVELLPSRLVFSFVIPPHLSSEISFISFSILFFFSFFFILSARSVGVSEEAREQRSGERQRTRAALCHPFVFASQRPARRLDYHVSCFVKERGVALRGLSNTVPFFFFPPPIVASHEERYSAEEEKVPVYSGAVFVFVQLCILCFERSPRRRAPHFNISSLILRLCNSR